MHVGIKEGGDGVRCWNREAVTAYVDQVNRREAQVAQHNPDVVVLPGRLVCYGCEVMEYDYGIKCTASLTRTRYAVQGETEPRAEDAVGSLAEVEGLRSRAPSEVQPEPAAARQPATAGTSSAGPSGARPSGAHPSSGRPSGADPSGAERPAAGAHGAPVETKRSGLRGLFGR